MKTTSFPLRALYQRVEQRGREDLPLLSVYRELGVVPREGRDDNHNVASEDLSSYKVVKPGDLVLNKMKTWQGSLGVSNYEGIVSPAYFIGRKVGNVEDRFMHHLLRSAPLIAQYGARSKGIRPGQWDLPWDEFAAIRVEIPSFEQQVRIADYLDSETKRIDDLIIKRKLLISLLRMRMKAVISKELQMVTGDEVRLSRVSRIYSGSGFPLEEQGHSTGKFPFFKVGDLANSEDGVWINSAPNWISESTKITLGCRVASPGTVLFPKVGAALLGNQRRITKTNAVFDNNLMAVSVRTPDKSSCFKSSAKPSSPLLLPDN